MDPVLAFSVPGLAGVVGVPILRKRERDDRKTDGGAMAQYRCRSALIGVLKIATIDPSAQALGRDVAPQVILQAAQHR